MESRAAGWSVAVAGFGTLILAEFVRWTLFPDAPRFIAVRLVVGAMLLAVFLTEIYHIIRIGR